jgi:hypothetical protein
MLRTWRQRLGCLSLSGVTILAVLTPTVRAADPVWYGWPCSQAPCYPACPAYNYPPPAVPFQYQMPRYYASPPGGTACTAPACCPPCPEMVPRRFVRR